METQNLTHPSRDQLAALALGKLTPDSQSKLQKHLENCASCALFVSKTPRDTMISLLQKAGNPAQEE